MEIIKNTETLNILLAVIYFFKAAGFLPQEERGTVRQNK